MTRIIELILNMFKNLSLTIIIELTISLFLGFKDKKDILNIIIINCITNPILNYLMMVIMYLTTSNIIVYFFFIFFELIVIIAEYKFYSKRLTYKRINSLLLSIILNCASIILGFIIT